MRAREETEIIVERRVRKDKLILSYSNLGILVKHLSPWRQIITVQTLTKIILKLPTKTSLTIHTMLDIARITLASSIAVNIIETLMNTTSISNLT